MKKYLEEEYRERAKLIENIEGYIGPDDGFFELKTETLSYLSSMVTWIRLKQKVERGDN